jgi:hypothetical protein
MNSTPHGKAMPGISPPRVCFFLLLFILFSKTILANSWSGDSVVCKNAEVNYTFHSSDPSPTFNVYPTYVSNHVTSSGDHTTVKWSVAGIYQIIAEYVIAGTHRFDTTQVTVNPLPVPVIIPDGSIGCTTRVVVVEGDGQSAHNGYITCFSVCDSTRMENIMKLTHLLSWKLTQASSSKLTHP